MYGSYVYLLLGNALYFVCHSDLPMKDLASSGLVRNPLSYLDARGEAGSY
jgi:hypothetical protein